MEDLPFIPSLRRRGKRGGSKFKTIKGGNSVINIKNILCPVDYSIYSEKALSYAIEFAEKYGAKLFLMHVLDIRVYDINDPDLYNVNIVDKETINKLRERLLKCVNEDTKGRISVEEMKIRKEGYRLRPSFCKVSLLPKLSRHQRNTTLT